MEAQTSNVRRGRGRVLASVVLIALLGGGAYYALSWNHFYRNAPEREGKDMTYTWQWKMYMNGMKSAYAKDTFGGATPEETLQLFVDALKAGDVELATKYYIPEKQAEVYKQLSKSREAGNLDKYSLHVAKFINGNTATGTDVYFIFQVDPETQATYELQFVINPASSKWKISAP